MNALDLAIIVFAISAAFGGYELGLAARISSWAGLVVGMVLGTLAVAHVADLVSERLDQQQLVVVSVGTVAIASMVGLFAGLAVGQRLRLEVPTKMRRADQVAGALAGILAVVLLAWILTPATADATGWPARATRGSTIARWLDGHLPEAPDASDALRRILGEDYPEVLRSFDPAPPVDPPPPSTGLDTATAALVARSTFEVVVEGCGQISMGSGFVTTGDLVATNAHVVAGGSSVRLQGSDGAERSARVVAFDPARDVAILDPSGSIARALPFAEPDEGTVGAIFGHPLGGPLRLAPFEVADEITATGTDIYDGDRVRRRVLVVGASLAKGDSGSPLVDPSGHVVGMTFALAPDRPGVAYALHPAEVRAVLDGVPADPPTASTGPCLPR